MLSTSAWTDWPRQMGQASASLWENTFSSVLQEASPERSESEYTDVRWYSSWWNHACVFGSVRLGQMTFGHIMIQFNSVRLFLWSHKEVEKFSPQNFFHKQNVLSISQFPHFSHWGGALLLLLSTALNFTRGMVRIPARWGPNRLRFYSLCCFMCKKPLLGEACAIAL